MIDHSSSDFVNDSSYLIAMNVKNWLSTLKYCLMPVQAKIFSEYTLVNSLKAVMPESICYAILNPYTHRSHWYFCGYGCSRPIFFSCCISCVLGSPGSEVEYHISHKISNFFLLYQQFIIIHRMYYSCSFICFTGTREGNYMTTPGPHLTKHGLTLIPAWIHNHIHYKVWDEIPNPFPNFNGATVEALEWISNFIPHFTEYVITYPCWD